MHALWAASVVGGLAQSLAGSAGALLARQVGGSDIVAGLPQAMLVAGSALAALALSALTRRYGRGLALGAGAGVAAAGGALVILAAVLASLPGLLLGHLLLGAGNTAVMLGRYAAADLGPEATRARAMASVLVATTIGAVAGPNLLEPTSALGLSLGLPRLVGAYLIAAVGFAVAAGLLGCGPLRTHPAAEPADRAWPREAAGASQRGLGRTAVLGLAVLAMANLVMVAVMTMAPVQLHHIGVGLGAIGLVVSLHIAGMFAPSPLSGWLTDHLGGGPAAAIAGVALICAAVLAALPTDGPIILTAGLVLLGIGWNLALLAGSALLTAGVSVRERPHREGWGEMGMGVAAAGGSAMSGLVVSGGGFALLAAGAAAAALVLPLAWYAATRLT